uniref:Peptidoglycan endopeptidase n=1 Tax=Myoviridae sp. ctv1i11 TaxID=2826709 RepID=A0A8S5MVB2_9CAUD|nr:MAG TPA: Peptidoglycan endopeptidase [Myoviridae sp. ctv1i11]
MKVTNDGVVVTGYVAPLDGGALSGVVRFRKELPCMKLSKTKLYLRLLVSALFLVCLAFLSSVSHAASSEGTSTQEPTISVPVSSWNELKGRLMKAENSINSSEKALQQANSLTATQGDELSRLKTINNKQGQELSDLKAINEKQGQELTKASSLLTTQDAKLNEASASLEELKAEIKRNKRTEQRLKRQRDTWAVVSGVFGLAGAIRR